MTPDWRGWLAGIGIVVPRSPNTVSLVTAAVLVAAAGAIGWAAGNWLGPRLADWWRRRAGGEDNRLARHLSAQLRYVLTGLLLAVVGQVGGWSPLALMLVAVALGLAWGLLAWHLLRGFAFGTATSAILAGLAFLATLATMLGGMEPVIVGLRGIGFTVGKTRLTLLGLVEFIVVVSVLFVLARITNRVATHSISRLTALDVSQRVLAQKVTGIVVVVGAVLIGIDLLGIDLTALTVFSGAFGLAVGFGLQKTFGNLISGLILLMDRSVKPGDVIVVGDHFGTVSKIGVRAVSVVTRDGKEHLIPNEKLMTDPVENWSYTSRNVRVHIPVGIGYDSDLPRAQALMIEAALSSPRVLKTPKPSVWLRGFGDSTVDHDILIWVSDPEAGVGNVRSEVLNKLWALFKENGVELPFPQRDVHVRTVPASWRPRPEEA